MIMGNNNKVSTTMIRDYELSAFSSISSSLLDYCYSPYMARNIIIVYALWCDDLIFRFNNNNGSILVYKDISLYFKSNIQIYAMTYTNLWLV